MDKDILRAISRARRRLNVSRGIGLCSLWLGLGCLTAPIITFLGRLAGFRLPALGLCIGLGAIGGLYGCLTAYRKRLGAAQAAFWLDRRLESGELLSSAFYCLERGANAQFDHEILRRASLLVADAMVQEPSRKPALRRLGLGLALAGIGLGLGLVAREIPMGGRAFAQGDARAIQDGPGRRGASGAGYSLEGGLEKSQATQLARELFPEDIKLARLAQSALESGRFDDLRGLLTRLDRQYAKKISSAKDSLEKRRLEGEREDLKRRSDQALKDTLAQRKNRKAEPENAQDPRGGGGSRRGALGGPDGNTQEGDGPGAKAQGDGGQGADTQGPGNRPKAPESGQADGQDGAPAEGKDGMAGGRGKEGQGDRAQSGGDGEGQNGQGSGEKGQSGRGQTGRSQAPSLGWPGRSGALAGNEPGSGTRAPAPSLDKAGTRLSLRQGNNTGYFEFILPEAGLTEGTKADGVNLGRQSESYLRQRRIPSDYRAGLRDYFETLSKEYSDGRD